MDDSQSKFSRLHEEVLGRYQQGGYLNGDYVKINKKALNDDRFSDPMKARIKELISDKKVSTDQCNQVKPLRCI